MARSGLRKDLREGKALKNILAIILTLVLSLSLAACSSGNGKDSAEPAADNAQIKHLTIAYQQGIGYVPMSIPTIASIISVRRS